MKVLKGKMPRLYPDHRRALPRRLRAVYADFEARFPLRDGISRRLAVLAAQGWLVYQDIATEANALAARRRRKGKVSADLSRLRRRQASAAGQFISGLRSLEALDAGNGRGQDLARAIAAAQTAQGRDRPHGD